MFGREQCLWGSLFARARAALFVENAWKKESFARGITSMCLGGLERPLAEEERQTNPGSDEGGAL
jgi:hypothetical protein